MLGRPLYQPPLPPERQALLQAQLDSAAERFRAQPADPDALLWLGRRLAYLGHYRDAIAAFSRGIALHPADARFYRHRGHRYITTRQFDRAIADLAQAERLAEGTPDQVEPDGQPNAAGIPLSTLQGNIHYHRALAHYLRREYADAIPHWRRARELARNDDLLAATSYWLYLTARKVGRTAEAEEVLRSLPGELRIIENQAYYDLLRLFRGEIDPGAVLEKAAAGSQFAAYGYGLAAWFEWHGERAESQALLRRILAGRDWAAFGYIAAETEIAGPG